MLMLLFNDSNFLIVSSFLILCASTNWSSWSFSYLDVILSREVTDYLPASLILRESSSIIISSAIIAWILVLMTVTIGNWVVCFCLIFITGLMFLLLTVDLWLYCYLLITLGLYCSQSIILLFSSTPLCFASTATYIRAGWADISLWMTN